MADAATPRDRRDGRTWPYQKFNGATILVRWRGPHRHVAGSNRDQPGRLCVWGPASFTTDRGEDTYSPLETRGLPRRPETRKRIGRLVVVLRGVCLVRTKKTPAARARRHRGLCGTGGRNCSSSPSQRIDGNAGPSFTVFSRQKLRRRCVRAGVRVERRTKLISHGLVRARGNSFRGRAALFLFD